MRGENAPWLWALPLASLLVLALTSGTAPAFVSALGLFTVAILAGLPVASRMADASSLERAVIAAGVGLGIVAAAAGALALAGALSPIPVVLAGVALALAGAVLATPRMLPRPAQASGTAILLLLVVIPLVPAPETKFDAIWYHLPLAEAMARTGSLDPLPNLVQSYFPLLGETLFAVAMLFGSVAAAKYVSFGVGLIAVGAVAALGARLAVWAPMPAVVLWLSVPLTLWAMATAYVEAFPVLFAALAQLMALRWLDRRSAVDVLLCAAFLGLALAAKLTAAVVAAPLLLALIIDSRRRRADLVQLVWASAVAALVASPWYVRAYVLTGNPVFPFLNGLFRSPLWDVVSAPDALPPRGISDLLTLPLQLMAGTWCNEARIPLPCLGTIPLLTLAALLALAVRRPSRGEAVLATFVGLGTLSWFVLWPEDRYLLPVLPAACVLAAGRFGRLLALRAAAGRLARIAVAANALLAITLFVLLYWTVRDPVPWRVDLGLEGRDAYLSRNLPVYSLYQWIDGSLPPGTRVLVIGHRGFPTAYVRASIFPVRYTLEGQRVLQAPDERSVLASLATSGFGHVILDLDPTNYERAIVSSPGFIERYLRLLRSEKALRLYEVASD